MVTREHLSSLCYLVLPKGCSISIEGKENFWHIDSIDGEVRAARSDSKRVQSWSFTRSDSD
ncbi:hypothetical protein M405DRAFT_869774 [Rhizopogon salebrosus TDB-379]|nr:hypothetical protein M405DRAFT_869774 [Rhizopogon salebrosus TDB-379]